MNSITKTNAERLAALIIQGIESWTEAGKLLVHELDNGATLDGIAKAAGLSKDILSRFEQIGRNALFPRLLASTSPGARALTGCPYSEQVRFSEEPVALLVMHDGKADTLLANIDALTPDQCKQVFGRGHIRDAAEQRAYLESKAEQGRVQKVQAIEDGAGYVISGKTVVFKRGVSVTKDDLIQILGRMK